MIRKNLLLCKIFRIKTSSKSLFDSYMAKFQTHLETCPICGSTGNCHIHDYYGRSIIDFQAGKRQKSDLCVMRVFCDSCEHAHAILPDVIIPYSSYSLLFKQGYDNLRSFRQESAADSGTAQSGRQQHRNQSAVSTSHNVPSDN